MIRYAIVGCGHIAKKHASAIDNAENSVLTAVCDTVPERMEEYIQKYGVKGYTDLDEMLQDGEIDVVNICTPSGFHADLTVKAANAKKHIVVEKPIALTLEDANKMIQVCAENNVKLAVVHPNRFRPAMMELKQMMDKGMFGKLSHANATVRWNRDQAYYDQAPWRGTKAFDGGVLMNQAIHNLDLLVWLMGDVNQAFSMDATRLRNIEAEDVSTGVVKFENGALGVVEAATTIYPKNFEESLSIFGEKGTIKVGGTTANFIEHIMFEDLEENAKQAMIEKIKNDPFGKPGHQWIIEDMSKAIEENREPIVTGEDGKRALELVVALNKSAETNLPINFPVQG